MDFCDGGPIPNGNATVDIPCSGADYCNNYVTAFFVSASNPPLECTPDGPSWKSFCNTPILAIVAACK